MWLRIVLAGCTVTLSALVVWLATHTSSKPTILGRYSAGYAMLLLGVAALAIVSLIAQRGRFYRRLYAFRREAILVLVSFLIPLAIAEVAIRLLEPFGVSYLEEATRYHLEKVADPILVYKHAPGLQRTYQGVGVSTNELGLRDRPLGRKADGELRILLLGDSVTFGWGVPVEQTFSRRLEALLASELRRPVRTVNAGVGSYNTVQEYSFLRTYFDTVNPDLVILIYVRNDIEPNDPPFDPWSRRSFRGRSPPEAVNLLLDQSWLYRLALFATQQFHADAAAVFDKNTRGVKESMAALSGMGTFCRDHSVPFVTFVFGRKADGAPLALRSEISAIGEKQGFPVVDVEPWWGDVNMRTVTNSIVDSHPNSRGHEILAAGMAESLKTHHLLAGTENGR